MVDSIRLGGVVLCGGKSRRMGYAKAELPFGPELLVQRVVRRLAEVSSPIVVVAAERQELPELPEDVIVTVDRHSDRGPLEGVRQGLVALQDQVEAAFVTSCDAPFLQTAFVRDLTGRLDDAEIVVPWEDGRFHHPLAAVYRPRVAAAIDRLLEQDRLRPIFLYDEVQTIRIDVEQLRGSDPDLDSLANLNHAEQYLEALARAGFEPRAEILERLKRLL